MTNLEAYLTVFRNNGTDAATLTLTVNGIDTAGEDDNELATAWAMYDRIMASDYSQGSTSETLSEGARINMKNRAEAIFRKYEVASPFISNSLPQIDGSSW